MASTPTEQLARRSIVLPPAPKPAGSYAPVVVEGGLATVSGQIVTRDGQAVHPGAVGREVDPATARELARTATLQALSALSATLGSIDRVRRVVRLGVYVASDPGFSRQHEVANGASELLIELFGEAGRPARVALGVVALPLNAPVQVELTVALA
jgi:enamine deaminase RidA (YjgF/YER057c/UK114 family)